MAGALTCNPSTWETIESGDHLLLFKDFKAGMGYLRQHIKTKHNQTPNQNYKEH